MLHRIDNNLSAAINFEIELIAHFKLTEIRQPQSFGDKVNTEFSLLPIPIADCQTRAMNGEKALIKNILAVGGWEPQKREYSLSRFAQYR